MLQQTVSTKYLFYTGNTDMRKGFDSLCGIITGIMLSNALSSDVYVFINRRRTQLKLLQWEGDGFGLYYKRLEKGTFEIPATEENQLFATITFAQLQMVFQGVSINRAYQRKRYQHEANNCW